MSTTPGGVQVTPAYLAWTDDAGNLQQFQCFVKSEDYDFGADVTEHPVETGSNITDNVRVKTDEASVFFVESDSPIAGNHWTTVAPGIQVISTPSQIPAVAGPITPPLPLTFTAWDNLALERALATEAGGLIGNAVGGVTGGAIGALTVGIVGGQVANGIPVELPFPPGLVPPEDQGPELTQLPTSYSVQTQTMIPTAAAAGLPVPTAYVALTISLLRQLKDDIQVMTLIAPYLEVDNVVITKIHIHRDADTGRAAEIDVGLKQIRFVSTADVPAPAPVVMRATPPVNKGEQGSGDAPPATGKSVALAIANWAGFLKALPSNSIGGAP